MAKNYTTRTAALKATIADIRKLNIKGTPFSKVISANVPDSPTENDIWKYAATTDEKGVVTINTDVTCDFSEITDAQKTITKTAIKVVDNKVLDANDLVLMNWDTKNFTNENGSTMTSIFGGSESEVAPLTTFTSDLSSLTNGTLMFYGTSLASFTSDLSSLTSGDSMFAGCTSLTSFTSDLPSLTDGEFMFGGTALTSFTSDLSSLTNGNSMFGMCRSLASFTSDLPSLTDGEFMFGGTALTSFTSDLSSLTDGKMMFVYTSLESFTSDLSSLTDGDSMFDYCTSLESFTSDLSSLTNGGAMFSRTSLASFTSDLPSLTNGLHMFSYTSLESFTSDLSSLIEGLSMFNNCTSLTSFTSDLSSLIDGYNMFYECKLDAQSVMFIIESIRDIATERASLTADDYVTKTDNVYSKPFGWLSNGDYVYTYNDPLPYTTTISGSIIGIITIGIDITNDSTTLEEQKLEFAKEAYYDSWADLYQAFADKGWTVTWQYGGTSTDITLSEDEEFRGTPIWARLIEVPPAGEEYTDEEKEKASYCTEDGTKYYNISWGHDVNEEAKDETMTDETKFFYFGSLLEACGYFGVIPKEYLEA